MNIRTKVLYLIEAKTFLLYRKTVGYPRIERAAWWLYMRIFMWSIPKAWAPTPLDNLGTCACSICSQQRLPSMTLGGF
jgi:hypothetical protein